MNQNEIFDRAEKIIAENDGKVGAAVQEKIDREDDWGSIAVSAIEEGHEWGHELWALNEKWEG